MAIPIPSDDPGNPGGGGGGGGGGTFVVGTVIFQAVFNKTEPDSALRILA